MTLHDEYARLTPFELAFPDGERLRALGVEVDEEAAARGVDATDPHAFLTLGAVGAVVHRLRGADAPPEAARQYGALVFHAVRFQVAGRPLYVLSASASRHLVEGPPAGEASAPAAAGYLQLPQHLFWAGPVADAPPESVDGMFWAVSGAGSLHVLAVTGVRPDRPGFGAHALPAAPLSDVGAWIRADVREHGEDYASALPGRELDRLYSVETAGELLKLLARFFAYLGAIPHAGEEPRTVSEAAAAEGGGPRPSALEFTRVGLVP